MERIPDGTILSPAGFRAGAARCGIKTAEGQPDVALIVSDRPAAAAGVFTRNRFAAAAVLWNKQRLPGAELRAAVANAGNANACTGPQGLRDVRTTAELVGELLDCPPEAVCVASTGIIGHPLPMDKLKVGVRQAAAALSNRAESARLAERAIMTTDTRPKSAAVRSQIGGAPFCVAGMAKGSGMIAPNMATMLCFVTTDAAVPPARLQSALREAADRTFNRITVDGDSSTNDSIIVMAGGASGARVAEDGAGAEEFAAALEAVLADLATQCVSDGEGATKVIEVRVEGALTQRDAELAARAVAESQLVKCAVYGGDPNWGRVLCAVGYSGAQARLESTSIYLGPTCVLESGTPTGADAAEAVRAERVLVRVDLGLGPCEATMLTCDLTEEYVRINAEYHT
jgi:glutamate N-acetyltransferase/amino-acid N-acetyltransferase